MIIQKKHILVSSAIAIFLHTALFGFSGISFKKEKVEKKYTIHLAPIGKTSQKKSGEKNQQKEKRKGQNEQKGQQQSSSQQKDSENREGAREDDSAPGQTAKQNRAKYEQILAAWLHRNQYYPMLARKQGMEGLAIVRMIINRDGSLVSYTIIQKTSYDVLNSAIDKIMNRSNPFPAVPDNLEGTTIIATVPIQFKLR